MSCSLVPYLQLFYSCAAALLLFLSEKNVDFETTLLRQREESEDKDFPTAILYADPLPLLIQKHYDHNFTFMTPLRRLHTTGEHLLSLAI